jgi:hypothetical protein
MKNIVFFAGRQDMVHVLKVRTKIINMVLVVINASFAAVQVLVHVLKVRMENIRNKKWKN